MNGCRPLLGVVQGWDPDFELKFGSQLRQSTAGGSGTAFDTNGREIINIIMSVDGLIHVGGAQSSSEGSGEDCGGWAPMGFLIPGIEFSVRVNCVSSESVTGHCVSLSYSTSTRILLNATVLPKLLYSILLY